MENQQKSQDNKHETELVPEKNLLTNIALTAADQIIIPVQPEGLSTKGVQQLLDLVKQAKHVS